MSIFSVLKVGLSVVTFGCCRFRDFFSISLQFSDAEEAKRALDQLNGFELAGRPMKVGHVTERSDNPQDISLLDNDELERTGIGMTQTGRLQLMAKLAEGECDVGT